MNIIFLTLAEINSIEERGIYQDLLRKFYNQGHNVAIVTPVERRRKISTNLKISQGVSILQVRTLNIQKTNIIEKGIGTLAIEYQYLSAIKNSFKGVRFDLILYSTPPITFVKVIEYLKKRDGAKTYLLLKDIFPQNAVDMNMLRKDGLMHKFFLRKEKSIYQISDKIGCMSPANVDFLLKNKLVIDSGKVEVNPNTIEPKSFKHLKVKKFIIREKFGLPLDKKIFVYGGNLGKPQGLDFLLRTIAKSTNDSAFFIIIGDGTEYSKVELWFNSNMPNNAKLLRKLPKDDYDEFLAACDVGLIYLHPRFSIPNFPSRLLSYLEMHMPVIAATDSYTDIGDIIEKANCGYKVLSGDINKINEVIACLIENDELEVMGNNAWKLLHSNYLVDFSYQLIIDSIK
jgi:glycosyltransferase involved in cell wall biosynthesis